MPCFGAYYCCIIYIWCWDWCTEYIWEKEEWERVRFSVYQICWYEGVIKVIMRIFGFFQKTVNFFEKPVVLIYRAELIETAQNRFKSRIDIINQTDWWFYESIGRLQFKNPCQNNTLRRNCEWKDIQLYGAFIVIEDGFIALAFQRAIFHL